MQYTMKFLALIFGVLMLTTSANAESPREQLQQMVEQLKKNPADNALREKIIKLAQEIKPAPAVPEEARRHFIKATTLQNEAKNPDDYDLPIQEYHQALLLAPWWSDAYFNLATALELKQQYAEAIQKLKLSILASPEGPDARAAQDKIYALEAKQDKLVSAKEKLERFYKSLEGGQWHRDASQVFRGAEQYMEIHGGEIYVGWINIKPEVGEKLGHGWYVMQGRVEGRNFVINAGNGTWTGMISEDGEKITSQFLPNSFDFKAETNTYTRVKNPIWTIMKR